MHALKYISILGESIMVENPAVVIEQSGWLDSAKSKAGGLVEKIKESKGTLFDIALYAGLGFLVGYLVKKFSGYLIALAIFVVIILALQQFEFVFVSVNWAKIQSAFGIQPAPTGDTSMLVMVWEWMKINVLISVSFIIGFLLGLKFGA